MMHKDLQDKYIKELKEIEAVFRNKLYENGSSRELSIALTKLDECMLWVIKSVRFEL